jgi:hypothetical protein
MPADRAFPGVSAMYRPHRCPTNDVLVEIRAAARNPRARTTADALSEAEAEVGVVPLVMGCPERIPEPSEGSTPCPQH